MENELENRMAKPSTRKNKGGRPKSEKRKPEQDRKIQHSDGKVDIEQCPSCGRMVKMTVYSVKEETRYCTCPGCGQRHALKKDKIRPI